MSNLYIKFTLVDSLGRKTFFTEHISKAKQVAIEILEDTVNRDKDTLYIYDEEDKCWKVLDYYNDL